MVASVYEKHLPVSVSDFWRECEVAELLMNGIRKTSVNAIHP